MKVAFNAILFTAILCASSFVWLGPAAADPWKDESGKGWRSGYERNEPPRRYGRYYRPPHGHRPPPGECRIWYPDRPPGQQPPPFRC
jgi:hypothetical protein